MTRDEIFERVRELLTKTFGLPAEKITPTALLQQDLDLDSIDAVDLVVYLRTGPDARSPRKRCAPSGPSTTSSRWSRPTWRLARRPRVRRRALNRALMSSTPEDEDG